MTQTESRPPATQYAPGVLAQIKERFPNKPGYVRRIHPISETFFRVNYHHIDSDNRVLASHFVQVCDGDVTELN